MSEQARLGSPTSILESLDRCSHGRHVGDPCAGWTGPGPQEGGCEGGDSLGNPKAADVIGWNVCGQEITVKAVSVAWQLERRRFHRELADLRDELQTARKAYDDALDRYQSADNDRTALMAALSEAGVDPFEVTG